MAKEILGIKLYTLKEVGMMLGVRPETVSKYIKEGNIASQVIGGSIYISEVNLKQFLTGK